MRPGLPPGKTRPRAGRLFQVRGRGLLQGAGTAVLAASVLARAVRAMGDPESVYRFYIGDAGPFWRLAGLVIFFGPYLVMLSAIAALWLRWDRAGGLGSVNLCASAFFTFLEGLTVFARYMGSHSSYVGADPLLSAIVCGISAATVWGAIRTGGRKQRCRR